MLRRSNLKTEANFPMEIHQVFSVHTTPEQFKNATTISYFDLCVRNTRSRETTSFPSTQKRKAGVFKLLQFEERLGKLRFRDEKDKNVRWL